MLHFRRFLFFCTLLAAPGCQPRPHTPPAAKLVPRPSSPKPKAHLARTRKTAPSSLGRGDFLLHNGLVSATVLGLAHGARAGSLTHPRRAGRPHQLGPLEVLIGDQRIRFQRVYVKHGETVSMRLEGDASANAGLAVHLRYFLERGSQKIGISLQLQPALAAGSWRGKVSIRLHPGLTHAFSPGRGYRALAERCEHWFEFHGPKSSYALSCGKGWQFQRAGSGAIVSSRPLSLRPGNKLHYRASLVIADPAWSAALRPLLPARYGAALARLTILDEGGEPLPGAAVDAWRLGGLQARARAGKDGQVALPLTPGSYTFRAFARGRQAARTLSLPPEGIRQQLRSTPPSQLVFDVRRNAQRAESVQLRVEAVAAVSTPYLLGLAPLAGPHSMISATGRGVLPLPPGKYRVSVLRPFGLRKVHEIQLAPFRGAELVSRAPMGPRLPSCRLLVDSITRGFFTEVATTRWAAAAGCARVADPARILPLPLGVRKQLLVTLLGDAPDLWPRGARPGSDVRYAPRLFDLLQTGSTRRSAHKACTFYSEGPIFEVSGAGGDPQLQLRLPPGFRIEKALLASAYSLAGLAAKTAPSGLVFKLPKSGDGRYFALSAKSEGGKVLLALLALDPRCPFFAPPNTKLDSGASKARLGRAQ